MYYTLPPITGHCMTTDPRFIGYFTVDIHHKTLQARFYVFEDTIREIRNNRIQEPSETSTPSTLDTISTTKNITFSKALHAEKVPPHNPSNTTPRSVIKNNTFQDHCLQDHQSTTSVAPLQDHSTAVASFQDHSSKSVASS